MRLRISACVIAKNEAANLGRWLASVQPIADEMIVVDTGSTDATADIARQGGARVYAFAWCDDFSAAKNFALDQATGDWVLFLDADEFFAKGSIPRVRPLLERITRDRRIAGRALSLTTSLPHTPEDYNTKLRYKSPHASNWFSRKRMNARFEGRAGK